MLRRAKAGELASTNGGDEAVRSVLERPTLRRSRGSPHARDLVHGRAGLPGLRAGREDRGLTHWSPTRTSIGSWATGGLGVALALIAGFMGFELVVGIAADLLAVLADAAHMLGDAAALALALAAAWIAGRPASPERTFGSMRAEILAALANGVLLVALAIWILVAAVDRLRDPGDPVGGWILAAGVGIVNSVAAAVRGRTS